MGEYRCVASNGGYNRRELRERTGVGHFLVNRRKAKIKTLAIPVLVSRRKILSMEMIYQMLPQRVSVSSVVNIFLSRGI